MVMLRLVLDCFLQWECHNEGYSPWKHKSSSVLRCCEAMVVSKALFHKAIHTIHIVHMLFSAWQVRDLGYKVTVLMESK